MKIHVRCLLILGALFAVSTITVTAQNLTLSGSVTDTNGKPIANALVKTWPLGLTDATDEAGIYRIDSVATDTNTYVYAIKSGYFTGCSRVSDGPGGGQADLLVVPIPEHTETISPYLFGSNYWKPYHPDLKFFRQKIDSAAINVVRLGGHSFDGTGQPWDEAAVDSLVDFAQSIDAEPVIQTQLYRGSAPAAAQIVHHANIESGHDIRFWSVGNEPDLYDFQSQGPYDIQDYIRDFRRYYHAMKAVDPTLVVAGPELAWNYDVNSAGNWLTPFLEACGDIVDLVTIHRYPFFGTQTVEQTLNDPVNIESLVDDIRAEILRITGRNIPIALTETNLNPLWIGTGDGFGDSHYAGLWWGETLGRLIKKHIFMANFWTLVDDGPLSMFSSDDGIYAPRRPRPTFYVHQLYKDFYSEYVASESDLDELVSFASRDSSGNWAVLVINKNRQQDLRTRLSFNFEAEEAPPDVFVALPMLSMVRIKIRPEGHVSEILCYSIREFDARIGVINADTLQLGAHSDHDAVISIPRAIVTDVTDQVGMGLPSSYFLSEAYPNPFSGATSIAYDTRSESIGGAKIRLNIYNIRGQWVATLVDRFQTPGSYEVSWNGLDAAGNEVANGLYFLILWADRQAIRTSKLLKLK